MPDLGVLKEALLAEYDALKTEQRARIGDRDKLMYANISATAAVIAAVLIHTGPVGLLLLPPVCLVLGWTYLRNDRHVVEIKAYVRDDLGPRYAALAGEPVFRWEYGARRRRPVQVSVEFVTFAAPAAVALVAAAVLLHWSAAEFSIVKAAQPLLSAAWLVEAAVTLLFGLTLLDLTRRGARRG